MLCKSKYCRFSKFHVTSAHRCGKCKLYGHGMVECGNQHLMNKLTESTKYESLNSIDYCIIPNCKYKWSHKTESHQCKLCSKRDHSSVNCLLNIKNKKILLDCPVCRKPNTVDLEKNRVYGLEEKCKACTMNSIDILLPDCKHAVLCIECCKIVGKDDKLGNKITNQSDMSAFNINSASIIFNNNPAVTNPYTIMSGGMGCEIYIRKNTIGGQLEEFFMHSDSWGQYGPLTDDRPYLDEFIENYIKV